MTWLPRTPHLVSISLLAMAATISPACGGGDESDEFAPGDPCDVKDGCGDVYACEAVSDDDDAEAICVVKRGHECDVNAPFCSADLVCAPTTASDTRCFEPVVLVGDVSDTSDGAAIAGAHVLALDEEGSAVTDIAESDAMGAYSLEVPAVRDEEGKPVPATFTLNAAAQDFQPFPSGARVALPIEVSEASLEGAEYVVQSSLTEIGLIPLGAGERTSASGEVSGLGEDSLVAGLLIVATGEAGSFTAVTDKGGAFTLFNLPPGDYSVKAYGAGIQVDSGSLSVASEPSSGLVLTEAEESTTKVSGSIQIVNAPGGAKTSVILVVADTFNETAARGEVPRGLRAPESGPVSIDGAFSIEGVPAGEYVVLAAYENDELVRDPDTNISGTGFVRVTVDAGEAEVTLDDSFKVTEALAIVAPGADAPEAVSEAPLLEWADDSSEDWYEVRVYDAFGTEVWNDLEVPGVSGSDTVSVQYEGPLDAGMYYQFRVTSWRQPGNGEAAPISASEDLRGVFYAPAE